MITGASMFLEFDVKLINLEKRVSDIISYEAIEEKMRQVKAS